MSTVKNLTGIPPQPFASWLLNESTGLWEAPVPHPASGGSYWWDEETLSWIELELQCL